MRYAEAKVYFDGSHYIAIPHTTRPKKKRKIEYEEEITIIENATNKGLEDNTFNPLTVAENISIFDEKPTTEIKEETLTENITETTEIKSNEQPTTECLVIERKLTKKEFFEELFLKYIDIKRKARKLKIIDEMMPYFTERKYCVEYVEKNFERKLRNLIVRRVRMCRKANLANFNYFCTFTYDSKMHTEESFKKGIQTCLRNMCYRKHWKYMGVWERAPKTQRLHFHGLFNIPSGTMPGELKKVRDYDTSFHRMQESIQSSYFNERFGRSDFKPIDENEKRLGNALAYLMKYIEKTGEKIVYSKNLPQYFISDIIEDDIVCTIGLEDRKLLLFDNFLCLDEGEVIGPVSLEVIEKMRKCN